MIVLDASALTDWLLGRPAAAPVVAQEIRRAPQLHTLHFADLEVLSALRRMEAGRELSGRRARAVLSDLASLRLRRHGATRLALRIWELRHSLTPYDAAYVALAEALAMPLLTTDSRLARSTGHRARIIEAGAGA